MPFSSSSRASSPERSSCSLSNITTPNTERSLLFSDPPDLVLQNLTVLHGQYVLVVGGLGYIGSHTTWELLKAGYNVIIVDNLSNSFRKVLDRLQLLMQETFTRQNHQPLLEFYEADYRDQAAMKVILNKYANLPNPSLQGDGWDIEDEQSHGSNIAGVIHFAAYKAVEESIQQPLKYYSNNVAGLINFCSVLGDFGIKTFVFSSSAAVYGELVNNGGRMPEEYCTHERTVYQDRDGGEKTTEAGCTGLTNPYGRTKWMGEALLNDLAAADPEWTIFALRYLNPIGCDSSGMLGEDPRGTPNNLLPVVVKVMTEELPFLSVYGTNWGTVDGTAIRDYIHVSDLARGHVAAVAAGLKYISKGGFRTFNLGSGKGHSVLEIVAEMEAVSGMRIPVQMEGRRDGDVAICVAEPSRACAELNWRTEKTLKDCCEDICRFLGISQGN